jgi:hypothetical protein
VVLYHFQNYIAIIIFIKKEAPSNGGIYRISRKVPNNMVFGVYLNIILNKIFSGNKKRTTPRTIG